MLTQPHNPCGRAFTRAELEGVRDVVNRHGGRVISDEIHAPLVLPGATHGPYLYIDGTADPRDCLGRRVEGFQHRLSALRADRRPRSKRPCSG